MRRRDLLAVAAIGAGFSAALTVWLLTGRIGAATGLALGVLIGEGRNYRNRTRKEVSDAAA